MATVFHSSKPSLFMLLLILLPLLQAASLSPSSSKSISSSIKKSSSSKPSRHFAQRAAMPQLTPAQCQLAKTQCPTLTSQGSHLDLDPQLLFLRAQYEHSLKRMKVYFQNIIDILIEEPSASPLLTLCANMGEDPWTFAPSGGTTASSVTKHSSPPSPKVTNSTSTTPAKPQPASRSTTTSAKISTSSTTPQWTTTASATRTTKSSTPRSTAKTSMTPHLEMSLTTPEEPSTTKRVTTVLSTSPDVGRVQGSEGTDARIPETEMPSTSTPFLSAEPPSTFLTKTSGMTISTGDTSTLERDTTTSEETRSWNSRTTTTKQEVPEKSSTLESETTISDPDSWISSTSTRDQTTATFSLPHLFTITGVDTTHRDKQTTEETPETNSATTEMTEPSHGNATSSETPLTTMEMTTPSQMTEKVTSVNSPTTTAVTSMSTNEETGNTGELNVGASTTLSAANTTKELTATPEKTMSTMRPAIVTKTAPTTTAETTTPATPAARCAVSAWAEWSSPVGFGVQIRERNILTPGLTCPQSDDLMETRSYVEAEGEAPFYENVQQVADNFRASFLQRTRQPRDLLLLVDASGSIDAKEMTMLQDALKTMLELFCGDFGQDPTHNRLAIVQFSNDAAAIHTFQNDQSPSALALAVDKLYPMYGYTCTEKALDLARHLFDDDHGTQQRAKLVQRDTLLLTDGHSNCQEDLVQTLAQELRNVSNIFALGIGLQGQEEKEEDLLKARQEIAGMVTGQDPRRVFSLADFGDLRQMVSSVWGISGMRRDCLEDEEL